MKTPLSRIALLGGAAVLATGSLAACGSQTSGASGADVFVVASFYPMQFVAEQIGGDRVGVDNLTSAGAEAHDLELEPRQMADITDADLVLYLEGFQPAVDEAVAQQAPETSLDAGSATELHDGDSHSESEHEEDHDGDEHGEEDHDHGSADPHVWLDPTKLGEIAEAVSDRLAEIDPDYADEYRANAEDFDTKLTELDTEFSEGLAGCDSDVLVTSHAAFGYLAERYDLEQVSVDGLVPDAEPSSGDIRTIVDYVTEHQVSTIFYETLVDPAVAEAIEAETGATTAVLDPIEGLNAEGDADYFSIMRTNLDTLKPALGCQA